MGSNLAWMAVEAIEEATLLERLDLKIIGEASDEVGGIAMARSPNGWLIIVRHGYDGFFDDSASKVSDDGLALAGVMYETTMFSQLRAYRAGAQAWAITHDPDVEQDGVQIEGTPPEAFEEMYSTLKASQAAETEEVDYIFDAPIRLAVALTGFDPNEGSPAVWSLLAPRKAPAPRLELKSASLSSSLRSELIPLMQSLGWTLKEGQSDIPHRRRVFDLIRRVGEQEQVIGFDFLDSDRIALKTEFFVVDRIPQGVRMILAGYVRSPAKPPPPPLLKRLFSKMPPARSQDERLLEVVEATRTGLIALHKFLSGEGGDPRIEVNDGAARRTWPEIPAEAEAPS